MGPRDGGHAAGAGVMVYELNRKGAKTQRFSPRSGKQYNTPITKPVAPRALSWRLGGSISEIASYHRNWSGGAFGLRERAERDGQAGETRHAGQRVNVVAA